MIHVENMTKDYGNFHLDCSMQVPSGRVTALVGQNGSGKSVTFKAILGLIHPTGGKVTVFGKPAGELTEKDRSRMGVVFNDKFFNSSYRIKDVTKLLKAFYPTFQESFFTEQIERFEIADKKSIRSLSSGMLSKLKVLCAISHDADLLILDEPTVGLDVVAREEILDMLREFVAQKEERSILISSHIASDLENLCDDFYMIHQGKIHFYEETDRLLNQYGIVKMSEEQFAGIDRRYLLYAEKESYGYRCLTNERQYYVENEPQLTVESSGIDGVLTMAIRGQRL